MLIDFVKNNLTENICLLEQLTTEQFIQKHEELSNASIGEHIRHIIEFYQCLVENYETETINYDLRKRNIAIQSEITQAIKAINNLLNTITKNNKTLILVQGKNESILSITTNYFRELLYNLEHSIHHQALIKVALLKYPKINVNENFGVAPATIEYRLQCAQ